MNRNIGICNADYLMGEVDKNQNYALEKVMEYHRSQKDKIIPWTPIEHELYEWDNIYCSKIFTFTDTSYLPIDDKWICGGTGFDVKSKLPTEIDSIRPKVNFGFFLGAVFEIVNSVL